MKYILALASLCLLSCLVAAEPAHFSAVNPPASAAVCPDCLLARGIQPPAERIAAPRTEGVIVDPSPTRNVSVQAPGVNVRVRTAGAPVYGYGYGTVTTGPVYYSAYESYGAGPRKHRLKGLLKRIFHRR